MVFFYFCTRWTNGSVITLDLEVSYDQKLLFTTDYQAHGAVLLLPVHVFCSYSCEFVTGGTIKITYKIEQPEKSNGYFQLISTKVLLVPKKVKFTYHDFFESRRLTDAMNAEINRNWKASWNFIAHFLGIYDACFDGLLRSVLEKVPADQIFDGLD